MATTIRPSPVPTAPASTPPTPPNKFPSFPRLSSPSIQRNASTSSSRSTTTISSTSSVEAAAIRPPPIETSTAATSRSQLPRGSGSDTDRRPASAGYAGPDSSGIGGRAWGRNGPRSNRLGHPPAIITSSASPSSSPARSPPPARPSTSQGMGMIGGSPTTPRQLRQFSVQQNMPTSQSPRVTISMDPIDQNHALSNMPATQINKTPLRGRMGSSTTPSSPTGYMSPLPVGGREKPRTLSVDAGPGFNGVGGRRSGSTERNRERRQSQMSSHSQGASSGRKTIQDFVLGEELGQGSYSTVFAAVDAAPSSGNSPSSPLPPRRYAIKIINQQHLVQEKKVKYAKIERDALATLNFPNGKPKSPTVAKGHKRGLSGSSSGGYSQVPHAQASRRRSTVSVGSAAGTPASTAAGAAGTSRKDSGATIVPAATSIPGGKDRLSIVTTDSNSSSPLLSASISNNGGPHSPVQMALASRRPSRCAEPSEMAQVPEQETLLFDDASADKGQHRAPSPVKEEVSQEKEMKTPSPRRPNRASSENVVSSPEMHSAPILPNHVNKNDYRTPRAQTPKPRRRSLAPSERSIKINSGKIIPAHPGIVRLHSTFVDNTSLYFVLDLVSNGEMTNFIRKFGSFDLVSARYYAAQLIDTIEYMAEQGVVHRDLKPENILLDDDMRIKITDFGSAKILSESPDEAVAQEDKRKRSFVGSADFVSPEVLRNEEATSASDVWAFGCILYQLLAGKPPFRGATDYLIFQKILKREMEFPPGFDEDAKALIDLVLNLDPALRPSVSDIKAHAFFATTDFYTIWTIPAPPMSTGLVPPVVTLASVGPDSDIWAVFDDEVSDGGFEYDQDEEPARGVAGIDDADGEDHSQEPRFDRLAAAHAVRNVDNPNQRFVYTPSGILHNSDGNHVDLTETLDPPRPPYAQENHNTNNGNSSSDDLDRKKNRGWSHGSSSSGGNRTALSAFLETMRIGNSIQHHNNGNRVSTEVPSNRTSRTSVRSEEGGFMMDGRSSGDQDKWSSLLLNNERIIFTSSILSRTTSQALHLPSFLSPSAKRRQLILTDFPRLITVKDDADEVLRIKGECVFVVRPSSATGRSNFSSSSGNGGVPNRVMDVQEKGSKGFMVQIPNATFHYTADTTELREKWIAAIKRVSH